MQARGSRPLVLRKWVESAAERMEQAGLVFGHGALEAKQEALWIGSSAIGASFESANGILGKRLTAYQQMRADAILDERISTRRPLAYLLHEAWLAGKRFYIDERVIVPRSFIAELLADSLDPWLPRPVHSVLDLCTGSACLAVLLAGRFPRAGIDAVDISKAALEVAEINVRKHRLSRRIELLESNLFRTLGGRRYDLIVSNPPYVKHASMNRLPQEYRHEPALALEGGQDGLDVVRRILREAEKFLSPNGILVCEIGHNRRALERAYPRLPFIWLSTGSGDDYVFLLNREDLRTSAA